MKTVRSRTAARRKTIPRSGGGGNAPAAVRASPPSNSGGEGKEARRQPFDRGKLEQSIALACRKRSVDQERIDQLVSGIQRQVETAGEAEIPSKRIGEMVMDGLRQLDSVAYIRFASVYRDFSEARDFEEFASTVQEAADGRRAE
jgi:transcriptional repressor NrdR